MKITLPALVAALLTLAGAALAASAPKAPIVLPNGSGAVTFRHGSHASLSCETCHPGGSGKVALSKDQAHALCRSCHERGGAGPSRCNECHDVKRRK